MHYFLVFLLCTALPSSLSITKKLKSTKITKDVVHFCDPNDRQPCGPGGECLEKASGNRCKCPPGLMGKNCKRPCQDVYQQCPKWVSEDRCSWTKPITPFFEDNCAESCGRCESNGRKLPLPLAPILDPLAWIVGKWECRTTSAERFPYPMTGPYIEFLDINIPEVPVFDRPSLNVTVTARSLDWEEEQMELGFLMLKPYVEDTGFISKDKPREGFDSVGLGLISNTGMMTNEQGEMNGTEIRFHVIAKRTYHGEGHVSDFRDARRTFKLVNEKTLEQRVVYEDVSGEVKKFIKRYAKVWDYLIVF